MKYIYFLYIFIISVNFIFASSSNTEKIIDDIMYGTPEIKISSIKSINKLESKQALKIFSNLISDPDVLIRKTTVEQAKYFPVEQILPLILPLFADSEEVIKPLEEYIELNKNKEYVFDFIVQNIYSNTNPKIQQELISLLKFFPTEKVFPVIEKIYTKNDFIRYSIAKLLSNYNDEKTLAILNKYLNDEIPEIQVEAAKSIISRKEYPLIVFILPLLDNKFIFKEINDLLLTIEDKESYEYFFIALNQYHSENIKILCINQLGKSKNINYLMVLLELLKNRKNNKIKTCIISSIEQFCFPEAENVFIQYIYDQNSVVRDISISMLIKIKSIKSIPHLVNIYSKVNKTKRDEIEKHIISNNVREYIYFFLNELATDSLIKKLLIIKTLMHYDSEIVYSCIEKEINTSKDNSVLETIIESLPNIKNPDKKIYFISVLLSKLYHNHQILIQLLNKIDEIVKQQQPDSCICLIEPIIKCMSHKNIIIKNLSYEIFQKLVSEKTVVYVYPLIKKEKIQIQIMLLNVIIQYPKKEFLDFADELFYNTKNIELKILICQYIGKLKLVPMHKILLDGLKHYDPKIITAVLDSIEETITYPELENILFLLKHKDINIKLKTVKIFSRLVTQAEFKYVEQLLNNDNPELQIEALKILKKLKLQKTVSLCYPLLNSQNEDVQIQAIDTIINISNKYQIDIEKLTNIIKKDISINVRAKALESLSEMGFREPEIMNLYFKCLESDESELSKSAQKCLEKILLPTDNEYFIKGLVSEKSNVRSFFINLIIKLQPKNKEIKDKLKMMLLISKDKEIKDILKALTSIIDKNDIDLLKEIYNMENVIFKCWVIKEIEKFDTVQIEELLLKVLKESESIIRKTGLETAKKFLSSNKIYKAVVYISENDPEFDIQQQARKILGKPEKNLLESLQEKILKKER